MKCARKNRQGIDQLELLLLYYVLKISGAVLADYYGVSVGALGGMIANAKRELINDMSQLEIVKPKELDQSEAEDRRNRIIKSLEKRQSWGEVTAQPQTSLCMTKEVAELLQITESTCRSYCREGVFPGAIKIRGSRRWLIPRKDVIALVLP